MKTLTPLVLFLLPFYGFCQSVSENKMNLTTETKCTIKKENEIVESNPNSDTTIKSFEILSTKEVETLYLQDYFLGTRVDLFYKIHQKLEKIKL